MATGIAGAQQPESIPFPARATGAEGTMMATQAAGEAERVFQTEKERQRVKAEQERLAREAEQRRIAEAARVERERIDREQAAADAARDAAEDAAAQEAKATADAVAAGKARQLQARLDSAASAGELFAIYDELKSDGNEPGSRAALRMLIAHFPENKLADVALTLLSGMAIAGTTTAPPVGRPAAPPYVPPASVVAAATAPPPAAVAQTPQNNACLAAIAQFNVARPQGSNVGTQVERQVFYGRYFERMLSDVPACRADEATSARVHADVAANLRACRQQPGADCNVGVADADVRTIDAAYDRIVAQAMARGPQARE